VKFVIIGAIWFVLALSLGVSGVLERLRAPLPQLVLIGLTIALLVAARVSATFRQWLETIDLRALVALHLTRFVGFYFLYLCHMDELPCDFATKAGWVDVLIATVAMLLLFAWNVVATNRVILLAWNILGFIDILFVVASAAIHTIADWLSMIAMVRFPLSLLLTFLVPLIITSHIVIFGRLSSRPMNRGES
jgi:hypothetical protein